MYIIYAIIKVENNQESETYKPQVYMFPDAGSINTMWKLYFFSFLYFSPFPWIWRNIWSLGKV